ncbi:Rep protein (plasmid) [Aliivibrio wodanis]|uniref:Rep protein n=1 Tax=Aliivibrio wodanis TaxID=80852 RepID=A0A090I8A0_9GAMM|nr:Rep protein [Aliivibrio wodanis]
MTEKRKPLNDSALDGEDSFKGSDSVENLPNRILRYEKAKARTLDNCNWLSEYSNRLKDSVYVADVLNVSDEQYLLNDSPELNSVEKLRTSLLDCSNWLVFNHYYTIDKVRLSKASFCKKHLMCPVCAIRRGAKSLSAYLERFEIIMTEKPDLRPYFLTLTVNNGADLKERLDHLQKSFKKYMNRKRDAVKKGRGYCELNKIHGGVFTYEFTYSEKNGWHPHIHMVALCDPSDLPGFPIGSNSGKKKQNSKLSKEWLSVTGDSYIVDFRPIENDPVQGFIEVFKYALKFSDLTPDKNYEAYKILKGKRLQGSFGDFWGVNVPEKMTDDLFEELPFLELFYRYTQNGYSLQDVKKIEI